MAGVTTAADLTDLIQEEMGKALMAPRVVPIFWPGGPAYSFLRVADLTSKPGVSHDFNVYSGLTAYDVDEGEEFAQVQQMTPTSVNVSATEHQVIVWESDPAAGAIGSPNDQRAYAADIAQAMIDAHSTKFDKAVCDLAASMGIGATDTGNDIVVADIVTAMGAIGDNPAAGPWLGWMSDQMWACLVSEASSALADASKSGDLGAELWSTYTIRKFLGVTWFITDNTYTDATDDYGCIINARALGAVIKKLPTVTTEHYDKRRSTQISSVAEWAVGVIESDQGGYLRFDA